MEKTSQSKTSSSTGALTFLLVGIAIVAFLHWKLSAIERLLDRKETPPQFEYRIEAPKDAFFQTEMDALGKEGWEIVSARRATSGEGYSSDAKYEVILKRQIR